MKRKFVAIAAALAMVAGGLTWGAPLVAPPFARFAAQQGPGAPGGAGGPRGAMRGNPAERLARQLNLTDAQKQQVQQFLADQRAQLQALRNDNSLTREQRINRIAEINQQTRDKIRGILSTEQQMKADELRQQAQERMSAQQEKLQDRLLQRGTEKLGLSDSQQQTIKSYLQEQKTQLQALRQNSSLTAAQKLEQAQAIRRQTEEKIRATLTADQLQKLDQLKQEAQQRFRHGRGRWRRPFGPGRRGPGNGGSNAGPASLTL